MYALILRFDVKPEHRDAFLGALTEDGRGSLREEPGTLSFTVIQDAADPDRFFLYETYSDQAALEVHRQGPHFQGFVRAVTEHDWLSTRLGPPPTPFAPFVIGRGSSIFPPDEAQGSA